MPTAASSIPASRPALQPALYLIPVPLSDGPMSAVLPPENLRILRAISHFVVEDLRSARRFLKKCHPDISIDSLSFAELNEHTPADRVAPLLLPLEQGHPLAVISEAGCPAVADPGADLVALAQRRGLPVVPLVGPSSILMGLMGSGFNGQSFAFAGYLPLDPKARRNRLRDMERHIRRDRQTQIFIETPYRNNRLIAELCSALPHDMLLCVASDITGPRQSILTRPLAQWATASYDYSKIPTIFLLFS